MTFTIPEWLLWTVAVLVGVPAFLFAIALMLVGWAMVKAFEGSRWK